MASSSSRCARSSSPASASSAWRASSFHRLHLELGVLALELVAALLQRPRHRVERLRQHPDLRAAAHGHVDVEVATAHALGRAREVADGERDAPRDQHRDQRQQQEEPDDADDRQPLGAIGRAVDVGALGRQIGGLGARQLRERAEQGIGAGAALQRRAQRTAGTEALRPGARHHRVGEVAQVRERVAVDLARAHRLEGLTRGGHDQPVDRPRQRRLGAAPRPEQPLVAGQQVAAHAALDVEHGPLGGGGERERALGVVGPARRVLLAVDGQDEREQQPDHQHREHRGADQRARDQADPHRSRP